MFRLTIRITECSRVNPNKVEPLTVLSKEAFFKMLIRYANNPNNNLQTIRKFLERNCPPNLLDMYRNEIISPAYQRLEYLTRSRLLRMMLTPTSTHLILYSSPHSYDKHLMALLYERCFMIKKLDLSHFWLDCKNHHLVNQFISVLNKLREHLREIQLMSCNEKVRKFIMKNCPNLLEFKIIYLFGKDECPEEEQNYPSSSQNVANIEDDDEGESSFHFKKERNSLTRLSYESYSKLEKKKI